MRVFAGATLMAALFVITGCSEDTTTANVPVASNSVCPIMGHAVTDDGGRTEFEGQVIGFCCAGCIDKWNALSDAEKMAKLENPADHSADHDHDHDHEDQEASDDSV